MAVPLHKAVVNLHAGLSQDGINRATNENEYNDIHTVWYDLTRSGREGILVGYEKYLDLGWLGNNSPNDPFCVNINRPVNSVVIQNSSGFPTNTTQTMAMDMWVMFGESGKVVTKGEVGTVGIDVIYDRDSMSLELNACTYFKKGQVVAKGIVPEQWYHFVINVDETRIWVIINGETIIARNLEQGSFSPNQADYTIGGGFTGQLNALRIYNASLDWLEIESLYGMGMFVKYGTSDLRARGFVPAGSELYSIIKVEAVNTLRVTYNVAGHYHHEMPSTLGVSEFSQLRGTINVPNIVKATAIYDIIPHDESDLPSTISVKRVEHLEGTLQVNYYTKLRAKYEVQDWSNVFSSLESKIRVVKEVTDNLTDVFARARYDISVVHDLPSTIEVRLWRQLEGSISINPVGSMTARYKIIGTYLSELPIVGIVPYRSDLVGNIHVPMNGVVTARYGIHTIETHDMSSNINVNATSQIKSTIIVPHKGFARATYSISPISYAWLPSELNVAEFSELFGTIMVSYRASMTAKYDITPIYFSWLESSIGIREIADLKGVIFISKEFKATARYEILERPNYEVIAYANKDAYVREFFPRINYGDVSQLYVGNIGSPFPEQYKTYIAFDLFRLPKDNVEVGSAILKLYYDGRNGSQKVKITPVLEQWQEHSITWANRPSSLEGDSELTYYFDIPEKSSYLEIDVKNIVDKWAKQELYNCGFLIEIVDSSTRKLTGMYSKEAQEYRPELHIRYYDMQVFSDDKVWLDGTITVRNFVNKDLKGRVNVRNRWLASDLPSTVRVKYPYDLDGEIRVGNPNFPCSIDVRNNGEHNLESELTVRVTDTSDLEGFMFANEKEKPSYIYVLYREDVDSSITVRQAEVSDLPSYISITENTKECQITVPFYEGIQSDITVRQLEYSDLVGSIELSGNRLLLGDITVRRYGELDLDGQLEVKSYDSLYADMFVNQPNLWSEISIRRYDDSDLHSSINVTYYDDIEGHIQVFNPNLNSYIDVYNPTDLLSRITVRRNETTDLGTELHVNPTSYLECSIFVNNGDYLWGTIGVRRSRYDLLRGSLDIRPYSSLEGDMIVSNPNFKGFISTIQFHLLPSTIDVKVRGKEELDSEIWVAFTYDIPSTALVRVFTQIAGSIIVLSGNLASSINIPAYGSKDLRSYISARVRMVSDLPSRLEIASGLLSSSIDVRNDGHHDLPSTVIIRGYEGDNLPSDMYIKFVSDLESNVAILKPRWINLPSYITARQSDKSDLNCSITIRVWNDPWTDGGQLECTIAVRQTDRHDQQSHLAVRRSASTDLQGTIDVKEVSDLDSSITVQQTDSSDLEGDITVRQTDKSDLPSAISAKQVSDLESDITVRQYEWSDLEGTINVFEISELESDITVRQSDYSDLDTLIAVRNDHQHDMEGSIDVFQILYIESDITVRQTDGSNLECTLDVRRTEYSDLPTDITVRQFGNKDLPCRITVLQIGEHDLPSTIITKKKYDIACSIEVMTAYPYAFIM